MRVVYDDANLPPSVPLTDFGVGMTRQSEAKDCDINVIMSRYDKSGILPVSRLEGLYADVSEMGDYRMALEQVRLANELFMDLPAKLRAEFANDAAAFLDFCSDESNRDKMVELGLIEQPPKPVVDGAGKPQT